MSTENILSEIDACNEKIRNLAFQWIDEEFLSNRTFRQIFGLYRVPGAPYDHYIKFDEVTLNLLQQHSGVPTKELLERAAQRVAKFMNEYFDKQDSFQVEVFSLRSEHGKCEDALHYRLRLCNIAALPVRTN